MMQRRFVTAIAGVAILMGCSSQRGRGPSVSNSSPELITSAEIAATPVSNAYDLINRLRPRWLQAGSTRVASISNRTGGSVQGQAMLVYLDDTRLGGLEALRSLSVAGFRSVRYYDAVRATTILRDTGNQPIAGAIVITTSAK
jgi:hypothetical protein